ncbi:hypothetical protein TorRG33x02_142030 [Trema orientale]|uniref:Uncharacterized protein n=1 Tax=Trema orientale TaxID=63057 RepID=A0A2P5EWJ7_TREOI|nr:hypothetical protein TorRG33x02_142030 [Trema orientale]
MLLICLRKCRSLMLLSLVRYFRVLFRVVNWMKLLGHCLNGETEMVWQEELVHAYNTLIAGYGQRETIYYSPCRKALTVQTSVKVCICQSNSGMHQEEPPLVKTNVTMKAKK